MITWPKHMTLQEWADRVILDLDVYGSFGKLQDPEDWRGWAMQFLANNTIGNNLPNPNNFDTWQEWAERFVGVLG